ncbi:MAG TPA: AGE family epimerase/isomerase [Caulobacteraceae bacterium]|nr:AGE family epimerase/isomerase [Caulobacteraceae bacterium]
MSRLAEAAERARIWLTRDGLPFWGTIGVDATGAFHERTDFAGRPDLACPRRMRVQARQLYVFSEAAARGWWPGARAAADAGFAVLARDCWAPDGKPGFIHTLTPDLRPLDTKRDAYDHAFGLFALAWYYKASAEPGALALAHQTLDVMQAQLADPVNGGFVESIPPALPRRSDPHMHLLEAMLEWAGASGEPRFLDIASQMIALFKARFFNPATGTLREYFAADLGPADGAAGLVVAPGHHFEWSWLLAWAKAQGAGDARSEADALYAFAARHGLDAQGFAIDECDPQGRQVRASRRCWPQTELIKAYVNKAREGAPGAADSAANLTLALMDTYLATDVPGLWMDQFDAEGRGITAYVPASTLYHLVVALRELMLFADDTP